MRTNKSTDNLRPGDVIVMPYGPVLVLAIGRTRADTITFSALTEGRFETLTLIRCWSFKTV